MEKLVIDNFLAIEHAEIEIKKINLFIGPQAQGKSLISKLIYFFVGFPNSLKEAAWKSYETRNEFEKFTLERFEKIFPKYTWGNKPFTINYQHDKYYISIVYSPTDENIKKNSQFPSLVINSDLLETLNKILLEMKEGDAFVLKVPEALGDIFPFESDDLLYIPAGRSFFATLEKNIFALINSDIKIDYFLTLFGKNYVPLREFACNAKKLGLYSEIYAESEQQKRVEQLVKQIICGDFLFENQQSWIIGENGKTNIVDASSGQQEALPIAILLSTITYYDDVFDPKHFIIEEPEAHLFPVSQNEIVLLIANAYNYLRKIREDSKLNSFTIATHSPYILTAFNNLIQAGNVAASKNYEDLDELRAVVPESEWVDFNDVTAYVVDKGTVKPILNHELKLIHANMIDEVSNHLSEKFRKLLHMEVIDE
ncbi:MAG: hypothetical protein CTY16_07910 [Methylobacter sp.]|nr:MAG: hypothetical protein CTY16_07910 [Methylobacter sp.]